MEINISIDPPQSGAVNMSRDVENYLTIENGLSKECRVRIYEWSEPTISVGIAQKRMIDKIFPQSLKIPIVERITGGRVVLHHREITYSIAAPNNWNGREEDATLLQNYDRIAKILIEFLEKINLHGESNTEKLSKTVADRSLVCFDLAGYREILIDQKKLIGSAQKRGKFAFLQHGSIPFYSHPLQLEEMIKDEHLPPHRVEYAFLADYTNENMKEVKEILADTFHNQLNQFL